MNISRLRDYNMPGREDPSCGRILPGYRCIRGVVALKNSARGLTAVKSLAVPLWSLTVGEIGRLFDYVLVAR